MSVFSARFGSPPAGVRAAPLAAGSASAYRRAMPLYVVPRTRVWLTEEELAAAADCLPAVSDQVSEHVRWITSYVVTEDDGAFSCYCVYEATSPEHLQANGDALMLPTDAIKPVATTLAPA